MSTAAIAQLAHRGIIEISGPDAPEFLQGLLTNDVSTLQSGPAIFSGIFAGLLSPQGKILFDFLLYRQGSRFLLDCRVANVPDLIKRLGLYKLRANVNITDATAEYTVAALWGEGGEDTLAGFDAGFPDPRYAPLGLRLVLPRTALMRLSALEGRPQVSEVAYHAHRIAHAVPEGGADYPYGDTFPHEACYDQLNGVSFKKGCYVGQEVVSRMQHRATTKRRIVAVEGEAPLMRDTPLIAGETAIGALGSADGARGIGMVRLDRAAEALAGGETIMAGEVPVRLHKPAWANYELSHGEEGE
jgi:folate-binding protein YgfZ